MDDPLERLRLVTRANTDKAVGEVPVPKLMPATIVTYGASAGFEGNPAEVHVDGDPPERVVPMVVLISDPLIRGTRVMVLYDPPEGGYIIGTIQGPACPSSVRITISGSSG